MQAVLPIRPDPQNHENTSPFQTVTILAKGRLICIDAEDAVGVILRCASGILWVTQEGLPGDVLLQKGEEYRSFSEGLIVVEALEASEFVCI